MSYTSFTSESVCAGHPDKVCDQLSDAIVDAVLAEDPGSHLGVETAVTENFVLLMGEVKTKAVVDYEAIARSEIRRLGYTDPAFGFDHHAHIDVRIGTQSPEIAVGVDPGGAGDQGMMFGYACRETPELMPMPIILAHGITRALDEARESGRIPYLRPDGKAQVTVDYENGQPVSVSQVTVAIPHDERVPIDQVKQDIFATVIEPVLGKHGFSVLKPSFILNGTGVWHMPGPRSDAGLTGRKLIVDTYGGYARVGGGALSGKDPSKVDRSGAYAARYLAKNVVIAGLADRIEVALAFVIGHDRPVMTRVETFNTDSAPHHEIIKYMNSILDLSVEGIQNQLDLRQPIYKQTAAYGHFGREPFPWEKAVTSQLKRPAFVRI